MRKLVELGLSESEATAKTPLYERADETLDSLGADRHRWSLWVPGRIEVLGKHTDYAGGRSLVCALERMDGVSSQRVCRLGGESVQAPAEVAAGFEVTVPPELLATHEESIVVEWVDSWR